MTTPSLPASLWHALDRRPPLRLSPIGADRGRSASLLRAVWPDGFSAIVKISRDRQRGAREQEALAHIDSPHVPALLGSASEDDRIVLLLEDLSACAHGDILAGVSAETARSMLRVLGQLHAHPAPGGWPRGVPRWREVSEGDIAAFLDRYPHPWAVARLRSLPTAVETFQPVLAGLDVGLAHADAHLDNWMFRDAPVLIDWETARVAPPAVDVVRVLMEGVHTDVRRAAGDTLLAAWAEGAGRAGLEGLQAAAWYSINAMLPHHAHIDLASLSPRMLDVHRRCAGQAMALAEDLGL